MNETSAISENSQYSFQAAQELFIAGGPVMPVLLALSTIALTVILLKLFQFSRQGLFSKTQIRKAVDLWLSGNKQQATSLISNSQHPIAVTCLTSMSGLLWGVAN